MTDRLGLLKKMPQQLIYTSAPRGVVAGRSGYCTVARSAALREALALQLEKYSYYQHLSLSGGTEHPIFACRITDIRGTRYHVLSRIQDCGLDFTGRTNFVAHHLVFTPDELRSLPAAPVILRDWPGWVKSWPGEPQLLENEDWGGLAALAGRSMIPAENWRLATGDAVNGYGLLEARAGASFRVDDVADETVLGLLAESLALLEIRDSRRDSRTAAWNHTFTTSLQEQDNPADFRWRCFHSDNPAAARFATPDCRALTAVLPTRLTPEEAAFARTGRQPPRFAAEPQDLQVSEGEPVKLVVKAEGVPAPAYQWYLIDREGCAKVLAGETKPELTPAAAGPGVSRYQVSASNTAGTVQSRVATVSVEPRLRLARSAWESSAPRAEFHQKSEEEIDRQRQRLAEQNESESQRRRTSWRIFFIMGGLLIAACAGGTVFLLKHHPEPVKAVNGGASNTVVNVAAPAAPARTNAAPMVLSGVTNTLLASATSAPSSNPPTPDSILKGSAELSPPLPAASNLVLKRNQ